MFCDFRRLQRWLDVEVALANSQAKLGMIPVEAAARLEETANLNCLDSDAIKQGIAETGHSLIPLLNEWQRVSGPEASRFIHYGATTQDIQDTAQSMELKEIFQIFKRDLDQIISELIRLAAEHKDLVIIGRTHGQHALPTTMGLKMAIWLDEILRHTERLQESENRVPASQLFGGVGTMAAFGDRELELLALFSSRLGLIQPTTAWHTARDRGAEFLSLMAMMTGTLAKIANEICQLAKDETGELEEPFHMGKIGSTTMPHKRNPELCEQVVVLARLVKASTSLGFEGLINEHERDYRAVRLEWAALVDASLYTCGALSLMKNILQGLVVRPDRIRRNLTASACLISTEALMFLFGDKIGKQAAHQLLYDASMASRESGKPLLDLLVDHEILNQHFSQESIQEAIDPSRHIGIAPQITDQVIAKARLWQRDHSQLAGVFSPTCPLQNSDRRCPAFTAKEKN